jgi:LemA protein
MILIYLSIALILILAIVLWVIYNQIIAARNIVEEAYSGIDIQLKKRYELIPNLIEAVKGYNAHEAAVLQKIVEDRSGESSMTGIAKKDASITNALKTFRIQVEAYPDLQANTQFLKLMDSLSQVENELAMARRYYNGATRDHNTKIQIFPNSIVAGLTGVKPMEFYTIPENQTEAPVIDLSK